MRRMAMWAMVGVVAFAFAFTALGAEEGKVLTKTGVVKKVDAAAKQVVVMVKRELTFTVTDKTQIVQGEAAKKLDDVKVDANVTVDYTRGEGDTRTAVKITILPAKKEEK